MTRALARLALVCAGLGLARPAAALDATKPLSAYARQTWHTRDGLPQASVLALAQTPDGHLWLATMAGLARFDGAAFTVFDETTEPAFTQSHVTALLAAKDGLWIGVLGTLLRLEGDRWRRLGDGPETRLPTVRAAALAPDGDVWLATHDGLFRGRNERFERVPLLGTATVNALAVAVDGRGRAWAGLVRGGLHVWNGAEGRLIEDTAGVSVTALAATEDGVWAATRKGLLETDGVRHRWVTTADGLPSDDLSAVLREENGTVWIGSDRGLSRLHDGRVESLEIATTLGDTRIVALAVGREGSLWLGTQSGGLLQLHDRTLPTHPLVPDAHLACVTEGPDGTLWAGTEGRGLIRLAGETMTVMGRSDGLPSTTVRALLAEDRALWVGTDEGLVRRDDSGLHPVALGDSPPSVLALLRDTAGTLWVGTRHHGVWRVRGSEAQAITKAEGLPSPGVQAIAEDRDGRVWLAGIPRGLARLDAGQLVNLGRAQGLPDDRVHTVTVDGAGTVWLGTHTGGLVRFRDGRFQAAGTAAGLFDDRVLTIVHAGDHLWLGSFRGVARVAIGAVHAYLDGRADAIPATSYDRLEAGRAFLGAGKGHPGAVLSRSGRVWFASRAGLVGVDPDRLPQNRVPPRVRFDRAVVDGRVVAPGDGLRLGPGRGDVQIDYAAPSLLEPHKVRHRYTLEGFDRGWIAAGARRSAFYTNVPPGHYTFRVQAANNDGVWGAPAALAVAVAPRFFQTGWFVALAVALTAGLLAALHRWRLGHVRARDAAVTAERTRLARELHDSLLQGLTATSLQLHSTEQRLGPGSTAAGPLALARRMVTETLDEARRFVWDLRPEARDRNDLGHALLAAARRLVGEGAVEVRLQTEGAVRPLPVDLQNQLFRIGQEAVTNAVKHARATRITMRLEFHPDAVCLSVTDDGLGFDTGASARSGSMGVRGMHERAASLGVPLTMESAAGRGTTVAIRVPLPAREDRT